MIIGIHGKARSGKDTAYGFIREWAESEGRPVRRDAFADRLKLSAVRALGFTGDDEAALVFANSLKSQAVRVGWTNLRDSGFITGRQYFQYYGDEAHRQVFGEDFWIRLVFKGYEDREILVLTDIRYINEAEAIQAYRPDCLAEIWHIVRPDDVTRDLHTSEQPLPANLIDHLIVNDGDLEHLQQLVQSRLERLVYQ